VRYYGTAVEHARLTTGSGRYTWTWADDNLGRLWWPIARSAIELATDGPVGRIKICASDQGCAGLFLDSSKNRSRRWCSMDSCGAEFKTRRQNARRRAARVSGGR
jgi:predicted RNA-binding Zn ribbon-like protein